MKKASKFLVRALAFALAAAMATSAAYADKPEWAGGGKEKHADKHDKGHGKSGKHDKQDKHDKYHSHDAGSAVSISLNGYFTGGQREAVRAYYGQQIGAGHCPPGLAKKNNGCMPPGQAKKWAIGRPLGDVVYYGVPAAVIARIGPAPAGHKYVRVAADILLIAIGTGMVVDAIEDLGRM